MQLKIVLLSAAIAVSGYSAQAQSHRHNTSEMRVVKTDSIVIKQGTAPCVPTPSVEQAVIPAPLKKSVPLAGAPYYGEMNGFVTDFVRRYLESHNRTLNIVQGKSIEHFSLIDNVLKQNDIPKELKYLAVIESALNNKAISHAGAVGPWQLMASTAKLMGLTVNNKRDDRKDWYKSTNAAAKYLNVLYRNLDDWLLVVAAYNSGPGPVNRAIERTGSHNFWDIKKYLPKETQGHVLAFIATATIFENLSNFIGLGSIPNDFSFAKKPEIAVAKANLKPQMLAPVFTPDELKNMAIVRLSEPLSMDLMSQTLNIDRHLLEHWNPDYDMYEYKVYSSNEYKLRIPKDKLDNFVSKKEFLTKKSRQMYDDANI